MTRGSVLLLALVPLLLGHGSGGCGGDHDHPGEATCSEETRDDTYVAGLSKTGESGTVTFALDADPAPPAKGDNTWTLTITEGSAPAAGTLTVTPFMPDHGHGTPIEVEVTDNGDGTHTATPVNLWMPGLWEVTLDFELAAGGTDSAVYAFCIEG